MKTMADKPPMPLRHWLVLGVLLLVVVLLIGRAVQLQIYHHAFLQQQGEYRHLRQQAIPAYRGAILDRNGASLAVSTPVDSIWCDPRQFIPQRANWPQLAAVSGIPLSVIEGLMQRHAQRHFVFLRRHVASQVGDAVMALAIPGVYRRSEFKRYYPMGQAAAHLIGFTDIDDRGQEGLELAYDQQLRGSDGARRVIRDRLGRAVEGLGVIRAATSGKSIRLSIDRRIQHIAYHALLQGVQQHRASSGSIVVLEVHSGEVLAMVNQPSFNPHKRRNGYAAAHRNRAVTDQFEPGSTIKPFTVAVALSLKTVRPSSLIDTNPGKLRFGKHEVSDIRNFGLIDVTNVIRKSSNVGAAKIGLTVSAKQFWRMLHSFGIGQTSGSGFPGEVAGVVTDYKGWRSARRITLTYGYGLSLTALQLARAYAALAAHGVLREVTLLRRSARDVPLHGERILERQVAMQVMAMLETVVESGGSGTRSAIDGFRVGGKTGTVRKLVNGRYTNHYQSIFVGMAPMSLPRLVVVVLIDTPRNGTYYGGQVAAPIFAEVMSGGLRILGVAPDAIERTPSLRHVSTVSRDGAG